MPHGAALLPLTNLDGLPVPGSDDIPWFVGLAARHIFTKRGQTYWKNIGKNVRHTGPQAPSFGTGGCQRGIGSIQRQASLSQGTELGIPNDTTETVSGGARDA